MSDEEGRVADWLAKSGYPLEFEVARAFEAEGFRVYQGLHYRDTDGDAAKPREIDVLAVREEVQSSPASRCGVVFAIECKTSAQPWIVLRAGRGGGRLEAVYSVPLELLTTEQLLGAIDLDGDPWLLRVPRDHGFRAVAAFSNPGNIDPVHGAFHQAVKGARSVLDQSKPRLPTIAVPVIVFGAHLYSMTYVGHAEPKLARTPYERILWQGDPGSKSSVIDLVAADHLADYARLASEGTSEMLAILRAAYVDARQSGAFDRP